MSRFNFAPYIISRTTNKHLLNIYDSDYYVELGTISIRLMDEILSGQNCNFLNNFINDDILINGVGKISNVADSDDKVYQLTYLTHEHYVCSSTKYVVACSTVKYYDEYENEKYAPLILIPISIDFNKQKFYLSGEPTINPVFRHFAKKQNIYSAEVIDYLERLRNEKSLINSVLDIDNICLYLKSLGVNVSTTCYLTVIDVEYSGANPDFESFQIQRSLNSTFDTTLMLNYYQNVKAVLPSNIEQKYLIYEAYLGNNIIVDGKLGTGKTTTIINILADKVSRGKKVLYINPDITKIRDFSLSLHKLGLGKFIENLTNGVRQIEIVDEVKQQNVDKDINYELINELAKIDQIYNYKYHGYTYSYIVEKIAYMKTEGIVKEIEVNTSIEREEIEDVYKGLKTIEEKLKLVDPFKENPWAWMKTGKNGLNPNEMVERTKFFSSFNLRIQEILEDFCHEYNILPIESISEFNHLSHDLIAFKNVTPLPIWHSRGFNNKIQNALQLLGDEKDINYQTTRWYQEHVIDNYNPGDVAKEFDVINKHYHIENENSDNVKYVDLLLNSKDTLEKLINKIQLWIKKSVAEYDDIKTYFSFDNPNKEIFSLILRFRSLYDKANVMPNWYQEYYNKKEESLARYQKIKKTYQEITSLREKMHLVSSLDKFETIDEIEEVIPQKDIRRDIKIYIDQKKLKHSNQNLQSLVEDFTRYRDLLSMLKTYLPKNPKYVFIKDKDVKDYLEWINFVESLSTYDEKYLRSFTENQGDFSNFDKQKFIALLDGIYIDIKTGEGIKENLALYNLIYDTDNLIDDIASVKRMLPYLNRVIASRNKILESFKDKEIITTSDVLIINEYDNKYLQNLEEFNKHKTEYQKYFGSSFKGFDTNVVDIRTTYEHFLSFVNRLNKPDDILKILDNDNEILNEILKHVEISDFNIEINDDDNITDLNILYNDIPQFLIMYTYWYRLLKNFSACIYQGVMNLQFKTFKEVEETLNKYTLRLNQVKDVYVIEKVLDNFEKYGLNDLKWKIQYGEYSLNIADSYLYSTLVSFYNEMNNNKDLSYQVNVLENIINEIRESEERYCVKNTIDLQKQISYMDYAKARKFEKKRFDDIFNPLFFNEYMLNVEKYKKIFIMDLDSVNNVQDLSTFDVIIVDDAHLSVDKNFTHIFNNVNNSQILIFGDKGFTTSITSTFMNIAEKSRIFKLNKNYLYLSKDCGNIFQNDNQYIYNINNISAISHFDDYEEFIIYAINLYQQTNHSINILLTNYTNIRMVYSTLVNELRSVYPLKQVLEIINNKIHLILMGKDENIYADDIFVCYDELIKEDNIAQKLYMRNYFYSRESINVFTFANAKTKLYQQYVSEINELIAPAPLPAPYLSRGVVSLLISSFRQAGLEANTGIGDLDIIIKDNDKMFGVIIIGQRRKNYYSLYDTYNYFKVAYEKAGWKVFVYSTLDLYNHYDDCVRSIIEAIGEANE